MSPKEKAIELYEKYDSLFTAPWKKHINIKQCALIAVDEILNSNPHIYIEKGGSDNRGDWSYKEAQSNQLYWQKVMEEIEKL